MPDPAPDPWLGARVQHYRAVQRVALGPWTRVYRATTELGDGFYALKVFPVDDSVDEARIRRFLETAKARTALRHPAWLNVVEAGRVPGCAFLVMEWLDGMPVTARMNSGRPVPAEAILRWTRGLIEAVAHLHAQGLVHRALHPGNLLIAADGNVRLGDIGSCRLLRPDFPRDAGEFPVEPARFLAPEERASANAQARDNLYALGTALWYLLAAREPFAALSRETLLAPEITRPILPPPDVPGGIPDFVVKIVQELLRPEIANRPADAALVLRWFQNKRVDSPPTVAISPPPSVAPAPPPPVAPSPPPPIAPSLPRTVAPPPPLTVAPSPPRPVAPSLTPIPPMTDGSRRLPTLLEQGTLPYPIVLALIQECLEDLGRAHRDGIVHGDLHPGRIVLDPQGRARLVEFGERTQARTPYSAPELRAGTQQTPDAAADLYALAAIFHQLVTGRPPAETGFAQPDSRTHDSGLSLDLEAVLAKALGPARNARYANAEAFLADVESLQKDRSTRAAAEWPALTRLQWRHPGLARKAVFVAAGALAVAIVLWAISALRDAQENRRREDANSTARAARLRADEIADRLLRDARALVQAGEWAQADRLGERIVSECAESALLPEARLLLGETASHVGEAERALAHLGVVYGGDPDSPQGRRALVGIAAALLQDGRTAQARAACDRVVSDFPDSPEARRAELLLADALAAEHRWAEAGRLYDEVARARPGDTSGAPQEAALSRRWLRLLGTPRRVEASGLRILAAAPDATSLLAARPSQLVLCDGIHDAPTLRASYAAPPGDTFTVAAARAADFDGDGAPEVVAATTGLTIFKEEKGAFRAIVSERLGSRIAPAALAVGDADNDGHSDIAVGLSSPDRRCLFYRVRPDLRPELAGAFALPDRPSGDVTAVAIGDWTGDGRNEVAVAFAPTAGSPDGEVRLIQFAPGFAEARTLYKIRSGLTWSISAGDLDGDRKSEFLLTGQPPTHARNAPLPAALLQAHSWRDERFQSAATLPSAWNADLVVPTGTPVVAADLDGDGAAEMNALWGLRRGKFVAVVHQLAWWDSQRWQSRFLVLEEIPESEFLPGLCAVDLDGDAHLEIVLSTGRSWWILGAKRQ